MEVAGNPLPLCLGRVRGEAVHQPNIIKDRYGVVEDVEEEVHVRVLEAPTPPGGEIEPPDDLATGAKRHGDARLGCEYLTDLCWSGHILG
jgi:hypothetical protein